MRGLSQLLDLAGASLSVLCAVHCLAAPLLLATMPHLVSGAAELVLGVTILAVASVAIATGFRRHGRSEPAVLFSIGAFLFLFGPDHGALELARSVVASLVLVSAHVLNYRFAGHGAACGCAPELDA